MQEGEEDRQGGDAGDRGAAEPPEGEARDEHHYHPADRDGGRGAEVGLQHHQRGG